jgi:hypothetical protein
LYAVTLSEEAGHVCSSVARGARSSVFTCGGGRALAAERRIFFSKKLAGALLHHIRRRSEQVHTICDYINNQTTQDSRRK